MTTTHSRQSQRRPALDIPEAVASKLARRFLIDPFTEQTGPVLSQLSDEENLGLQSLALAMGVSVDELPNAPHLRQQALELLAKLMQENALTEQRSRAAKESLGQAGLLSPSLYIIEFGDLIKAFEQLGERRGNIEQVIHSPDVVQHLEPPGGLSPESDESQSIFVREIRPAKKKRFLQMVVARRTGSKLTFGAAWRFYSEFVSWDGTMSPLDLLRRFVDRYGIPFSIGDMSPTKFLLNESIAITDPKLSKFEIRFHDSRPRGARDILAQVAIRHDVSQQKLFLSLGYVIDAEAYAADMRKVK